jgi:four helix bundle protein
LSVELNIAEGYTFGPGPTYTRHLGIAFGSAVETNELLRIALEAGVLDAGTAVPLLERSDRACRLLVGLLKKRRKFKT